MQYNENCKNQTYPKSYFITPIFSISISFLTFTSICLTFCNSNQLATAYLIYYPKRTENLISFTIPIYLISISFLTFLSRCLTVYNSKRAGNCISNLAQTWKDTENKSNAIIVLSLRTITLGRNKILEKLNHN